MTKKKLYGIFAFIFIVVCALGLALGFSACSNDKEKEDNGIDPIIGTWEGDVKFHADFGDNLLGTMFTGDYTADTTIVVDEEFFSLTVTIDLGIMTFENYTAIENAEWRASETEGKYTAYANISEIDYEIPIEVIDMGNGNYEMSLTTEIVLVISGMSVTATFDDARVSKISDDTTQPSTKKESEPEDETTCTCGEECTCGDTCECGKTCGCEDCGNTAENGCSCGEDCSCEESCDCGEECACEECSEGEDN